MAGFTITTQDSLLGPDGDEPYVLFVNQTEYGNGRYRFAGLRLPAHQCALGSARPQEVQRPALSAADQAPPGARGRGAGAGAGVPGGPGPRSTPHPGEQRPAPAAGGLPGGAGGGD
jgi:hypothetical protein